MLKGYKLTGRGKLAVSCLALIAVVLLASAFKLLAQSAPSVSPSLSPSAPVSPGPAANSAAPPPTQTPQGEPSATPAAAPVTTPTAKPTPAPTAKPVVKPADPPASASLPAAKTSLYFTPGTLDLLAAAPALDDYLLDSYEGFTLVVEGFASEEETTAPAQQLALDRSKAVMALFRDLGVQSDDLLSIAAVREAQDEEVTADLARVDIYFLPSASK